MEFCDNIKKIRDNNGLTQAQFASKLGLSTPTVAAWENGSKKPSFDVLIQIAKIFNVSLDWLCGINKLPKLHFFKLGTQTVHKTPFLPYFWSLSESKRKAATP